MLVIGPKKISHVHRLETAHRSVPRLPCLAYPSHSPRLSRRCLPQHVPYDPTPFRSILEALDRVPIHPNEEIDVPQNLHKPAPS
jgi:hypothetical protein